MDWQGQSVVVLLFAGDERRGERWDDRDGFCHAREGVWAKAKVGGQQLRLFP